MEQMEHMINKLEYLLNEQGQLFGEPVVIDIQYEPVDTRYEPVDTQYEPVDTQYEPVVNTDQEIKGKSKVDAMNAARHRKKMKRHKRSETILLLLKYSSTLEHYSAR
jgi:hypothetical protein